MSQKLVFASSNQHKIKEIRSMLGEGLELVGLTEIGCHEDIPETAPTIPGNALQKARYVVEHFGLDCFSEDTGLEIDALNGEPGVHTARYAGEAKDPEANIAKALSKLEGVANRSARFRTVIALIQNGQEHLFEGVCEGSIAHQKSGSAGFGYDPVFIPQGEERTFAEMSQEEKNRISHRAKAFEKFYQYILDNQ